MNDNGFAACGRPDIFRVRFHRADRRFFAGDKYFIVFFADHHGTKLQTVVQGHQAAAVAEDDRKRTGDQKAREKSAQVDMFLFVFEIGFLFNRHAQQAQTGLRPCTRMR